MTRFVISLLSVSFLVAGCTDAKNDTADSGSESGADDAESTDADGASDDDSADAGGSSDGDPQDANGDEGGADDGDTGAIFGAGETGGIETNPRDDSSSASTDEEPADAESSSEAEDASALVSVSSSDALSLPPSGSTGTLRTNLFIDALGIISDVNVALDLKHTCTKDLSAILTSPRGTTVELFDLTTGLVCGSDMSGTIMDDEAPLMITSGAAPFVGAHRPTGFLSAFDGERAAGVWTLTVIDEMVGDEGMLNSWSLELDLD